MSIKRLTVLGFLFLGISVFAQEGKPPKLIVGVVVDQFRYDLLTKFRHNFSDKGFNRILNNGFFAENMHYDYMPTYTGPGHASIYTGTIPAIHGIAANNWIQNGEDMYCTQDDSASTIGSGTDAGKMSPKNLLVSTVTDELRLSNNFKSNVIAISLKDRGAILPGGHLANKAFWYDSKSGKWITSDYYMHSLPAWLEKFNSSNAIANIMKDGWKLYYEPKKYTYLDKDNAPWELSFDGQKVTMPYSVEPNEYNSKIRYSPFGNSITTLLAKEVLNNENLGKGDYTDFLAVSYSSTDYVGHAFGPNSLEIEDTYYRLDKEIEDLLDALDAKYGKDNYWVFVTGDHGVQNVPAYANFLKMEAGLTDEDEIKNRANKWLSTHGFSNNPIAKIKNSQIYLTEEARKDADDIAESLNLIPTLDELGVRGVYAFEELQEKAIPFPLKQVIINGYFPRRSGEIAILVNPGWMTHGIKGTSHGSPYSHDTHVPFLFYGKGVHKESSSRTYSITDIAPTLSYLLSILQPNGCVGKPIIELEYVKTNQ